MDVLNGKNAEAVRTLVPLRRWAYWPLLALFAGCGTTEFEARPAIPTPLVEKIPVVIGVYMAPEFREKVYREERDGADVAIALGKAQTEGFTRLMDAMFLRTVQVAWTDAGARTDPAIRGVLEPVLDDVAFVTPTDSRGHSRVTAPPQSATCSASARKRCRRRRSWPCVTPGRDSRRNCASRPSCGACCQPTPDRP